MDYIGKVKRKINPRETANFFSLISFGYTVKLFCKAFKKDLEEDDLYDVVKSCRSSKCGHKLEKQWNIEKQKTKPSLAKLLWTCYGLRYGILAFIHLTYKIVTSILEPEAIGKLVSYFKPNQTQLSFYDALCYASIMIGIKILNCFYGQNYIIYLQQLGLQISAAFSSLIYRKSLRLTPSAMDEFNLGNIITILTKDIPIFESSLWFFNEIWIEFLRAILVCYLIYNKAGIASLSGIGIMLAVIPFQIFAGNVVKKMRSRINKKTDERLQVTQETLSAIKIIKMYTWEKIFNDKVDEKRKQEMKVMMKSFCLKFVMITLGVLTTRLAFYSIIITYTWLNSTVSAEVIFYVMECFTILKRAVGVLFSIGFGKIGDFIASIKRINDVLQAEELTIEKKLDSGKPTIIIEEASVKIKQEEILKDISWNMKPGLTALTGPLGSGKSSLLKLCLRDYPLSKGNLICDARLSYSAQDPWLFPSTIKQNIIFGEKYDVRKYNEVVKVCALDYDFRLLDNNDETIVADRGLNLSKGQQARINLARAVYRESDVYLLDDPLNALDASVQDFVFNKCIRGFLKDKRVVLVTHNRKHIEVSDNIVVMKNGAIKFEGKREEIVNDAIKEIEDFKDDELDNDRDEKLQLPTNEVKRKVYSEIKKEGKVDWKVYKDYSKMGGGIFMTLFIIVLYAVTEFTESYSKKLVSLWVNLQEKINEFRDTNEPADEVESESASKLKLYSIMIITCCLVDLLKQFVFANFTRKASVNLHKKMIRTMTRTNMSFFDNYFIGNILNRFSRDLSLIDESLPQDLNVFFWIMFSSVGTVFLIASVGWLFLIPCTIFITLLAGLRILYMPASRSLKRLESATRSPMVGHLNASIEGLTTIRAYKNEKILEKEFDRHQDLYVSTHFTAFCIKRAFVFFMDLFSMIFLTVIVSRFLFFSFDDLTGDVGLAITKASTLTMVVQWCLIDWAELENNMTCVERALEYTELKEENYAGEEIEKWPARGIVRYDRVSLTYENTQEKCLRDISFTADAKQKIGIVGRTGAGKSSIISTLFRLYDFDGTIWIDGIDTKKLSLNLLRENISIIPQNPILFEGTIRSNIDPLSNYTDEEIWKTIEKLTIKSIIPTLDTHITDYGSNFSTGQRQLICLARAVIKKNKVVVMDEATSNMDPETESLIQRIIDENFADCTVLIIAHRLKSVLDCYKIMVMEKGEIKEFDSPQKLAKDETSLFHKMLKSCDID